MARIRIIVEDGAGKELTDSVRVYELGQRLDSLHEIEAAVERFKWEALPDLTASLLYQAQERALADPKKGVDGSAMAPAR